MYCKKKKNKKRLMRTMGLKVSLSVIWSHVFRSIITFSRLKIIYPGVVVLCGPLFVVTVNAILCVQGLAHTLSVNAIDFIECTGLQPHILLNITIEVHGLKNLKVNVSLTCGTLHDRLAKMAIVFKVFAYLKTLFGLINTISAYFLSGIKILKKQLRHIIKR